MAPNLKETLESYIKKESFSVIETIQFFDDSLVSQIKNANISDDLKKDFDDVYQEVCDTEYWEDWNDDCEQTLQVIMSAFEFVIERILKEL
jgi:hypothetical protein